MIVINPLDEEITVTLSGNVYTVPAKGQVKGVPVRDALYWKDSLHNFLTLQEEISTVTKPMEEETKVEEVVEVAEEAVSPSPEAVEEEEIISEVKE